MPDPHFFPDVLDLSHHNDGPHGGAIDFKALARFGVKGIIHKASQGTRNVDGKYEERREAAIDAGLLWGAYHFATADDVDEQVAHFMEAAQPDEHTLMALDHEPNQGNELDIDGAQSFLESLRDQNGGRLPVIYSGNLIKEQNPGDFFGGFRLWLAQYGDRPKWPSCWQKPWLHQFSGDGTNNHGIVVPGINAAQASKLDMNRFYGSDLAAEWA